jgi:uncharacterized protein (TIGR03435 family)
VRSDKYTIEAVGDGATAAETMRGPLLQELLERRFNVKAHVEAEQVPGFALAVASGGLRSDRCRRASGFSRTAGAAVPRC